LKPEISINQENYVKLSKKGKIMIEEALETVKNGDIIGPFSDIKTALEALKES
jgi:hypothetical protein